MHSDELGEPFAGGEVSETDLKPTHLMTMWLVATLFFSLLPYGLLMVIYRALHDPHQWPAINYVLGRGDLGAVVIAVTGATIAEITVNTSAFRTLWRGLFALFSVLSGSVAMSVFAVAQYQALANQKPDYEVNTVLLSSLLLFVVIVHVLFVTRRRRRRFGHV